MSSKTAVSDSQLADVLKAEEARHTRLLSRRRFWVQLLISVLVAVFAMSMIAWGKTDSALEKGLFGLLGTVLGYWLR